MFHFADERYACDLANGKDPTAVAIESILFKAIFVILYVAAYVSVFRAACRGTKFLIKAPLIGDPATYLLRSVHAVVGHGLVIAARIHASLGPVLHDGQPAITEIDLAAGGAVLGIAIYHVGVA